MPKTEAGLVRRKVATWLARALNLQGITSWYSSSGWSSASWWPGIIRESFSGAWQQNVVEAPVSTLLSFSAVYACVTGIAADVSKMRIMLSRNDEGIWTEITANQPWLPLLRNPNHYQDRIRFIDSWMLSKLMYGNTYALKGRDARGVVNRLYILHPSCVKPLVAEDSSVYYELQRDDLSGLTLERLREIGYTGDRIAVPASEIIHDRMATLWHPLVGISPLYACAMSATMGNKILNNSTNTFANGGMPSGIITVPGAIGDDTAALLKARWETNFGGANVGRTAVLADGLKFDPVTLVSAEFMQLIEQLKWTVEDVARAFRYPLWKLGGPAPPYTKPDQAQTLYYTDCLGPHIISIESCLDNGLELPLGLGTEFDLDELMRMDTESLYESNNKAKGWMKLDEQRYRANLPPLKTGGDTVYLQHQDYSVEALAKRDAKADPFSSVGADGIPDTKPTPPEPNRGIDAYDLHRLVRQAFPQKLEKIA